LRFDSADFPDMVGKTEGMGLLGDGSLALNDDDFGITGGRLVSLSREPASRNAERAYHNHVSVVQLNDVRRGFGRQHRALRCSARDSAMHRKSRCAKPGRVSWHGGFPEFSASHRGARGLHCNILQCGIVSDSWLKAATRWTKQMSFWLEWFTLNAVVTWCRITARGCWGFAWQGQGQHGQD
jgi:hypothetical protein